MEKVRKIISLNSREFFFDADAIIMIRKIDHFGWWDENLEFLFNQKTKKLAIYYPAFFYQSAQDNFPTRVSGDIEITYYSKKDERKLKLEKLNSL